MNNKWTREETIIAFNVYCRIPFKDSNKNHPMIPKFRKEFYRKISNGLINKGLPGLDNVRNFT